MLTTRWINVEIKLYQRCFNVVSTLFQRRTPTLYQRYATLKIWRRILFHFQRRINVISTLIHNVGTTLIRRWNVGWGRITSILLSLGAIGPVVEEIWVGLPHPWVRALPSFGGHGSCECGGITFLICHVTTICHPQSPHC